MYSHDTVGLGHLRRNLLIAQTLRQRLGVTVLMVSGAWEGGLFELTDGIDCVTLPALAKDAQGRYGSRRLGLSYEDVIRLRSRTIEGSLLAFEPDLLIVDKVPGGVGGELLPALRQLHRPAGAARGTRCVLGLRDVLDDATAVRRDRLADQTPDVVRAHYDAVWVYGDAAVYDVVGEHVMDADVAAKVRYTGYLNRRPATPPTTEQVADALAPLRLPTGPLTLCMVGGGQDGQALAGAFARATLPPGVNGLILTGPFMPADARRALQRTAADSQRLRVVEFTSDTAPLLAAAERVVTMGGYNSVCEVLSHRKRALVVPRMRPRREQLVRARRLERLGLLDMLHPDDLCPAALTAWLASPTGRAEPSVPAGIVDFDGLERVPELVRDLCAKAIAAGAGRHGRSGRRRFAGHHVAAER